MEVGLGTREANAEPKDPYLTAHCASPLLLTGTPTAAACTAAAAMPPRAAAAAAAAVTAGDRVVVKHVLVGHGPKMLVFVIKICLSQIARQRGKLYIFVDRKTTETRSKQMSRKRGLTNRKCE